MDLKPKNGIGDLLFGMKQKDVEVFYGKPDKHFRDEDKNVIYVYNDEKLRLTFYEDEDFRLGYLICANPGLLLFGDKVIGRAVEPIKAFLEPKGFKVWEEEDFDLAENHFNEANWLILQAEFGFISKVELGAVINAKDEFEWKFK
jgi:hypothetical protein